MHSPSPADPAGAKHPLREAIRRQRGQVPAAQRLAAQRHLDTLLTQFIAALRPACVFCYLATDSEAGTRSLIDELISAGTTVLVPRLIDRTTMIATAFPGWSALRSGALGILSPPSTVAHEGPIDAVVVPGLAFSARGARLGYGAGYYDRWLAGHPAAVRLGLCFDYQVLQDLPTAAHDEPLDYLVTDRRLYVCTSGRT